MEPLLFIVFIYIFTGLAFARMGWRRWRRWRRDETMRRHAWDLMHHPIDQAIDRFGPPIEQFQGSENRMYEWRSPPAAGFPPGSGVLIVQLITDPEGSIIDMHWHARGGDI